MVNLTEKQLRLIFVLLSVFCFILFVFITPQYGISGDAITQNTYGQFVWKYISSFGANKEVLTDPFIVKKTLNPYGGFFDGMAAMWIQLFKPKDEFLLRHYWNMIFGFLAVLYTGLLSKELTGSWRAGIFGIIFIVLVPRFFGEMFNNPKDIPFAAGYIVSLYYIVRWLKNVEQPNWKLTLVLGLALALGISIRIGGLLLIAYFGLFYLIQLKLKNLLNAEGIKKTALHLVVACGVGYLLACLFWPFALEDIINNPLEALKTMSSYPLTINMLFDGHKVNTGDMPSNYLFRWFEVGMPLFVLFGILGGIFFTFKNFKQKDSIFNFLMLFAIFFPIFYIVYKKSVVYDGLRHLLFVMPVMAVVAALFYNQLLDIFKNKKPFQYATAGVLVILLLLPARFMAMNHPNQIVYFNELIGGIKGAYGNFETDYYMNSVKQAAYRLADTKDLYNSKDTVIVATNAIEPMRQYMMLINPKIRVEYVRYPQRYDDNWDYAILYNRFIDRDLLLKGYYPPANSIEVVEADRVPLCVVVARGNNRFEIPAAKFLKEQNFAEAAVYYAKAIQENPKNETAYIPYAIALANTGQIDEAIKSVNACLKMTPSSLEAYDILAKLYQAKGDIPAAQKAQSDLNYLMNNQ